MIRILYIIILAFIILPYQAIAVDLFEENFDTGGVQRDDTWTLRAGFDDINQGVGDIYEIVSFDSHSGGYSLRFNYNGRNGFCNTCGTSKHTQKSGFGNASFFVSDSGEDLTLRENSDQAAARSGKRVYNVTDGHTLWEVVSVDNQDATNDKLDLRLIKDGIGNNTRLNFQSGDQIEVARQCEVDGSRSVNKPELRSNCDEAISYFSGVPGTQQLGQSIYRRFYIKIEAVSVNYQTKLHFLIGKVNGSNKAYYLNLKTSASTFPDYYLHVELAQFKPDDPKYFYPNVNGELFTFKRGNWYYVEEQFKASDPVGALNGEYRLWLSEAGQEPVDSSTPIVEVTGFNVPVVDKNSLFGNVSSLTHSYGYIYLDDYKIAHDWNGPVTTDLRATNTLVPSSPPSELSKN